MTTRSLIRRATAGDVPAIVDLLHRAYEEYRGRLDPPSGAHRESLASIGDLRNRTHALVADLAGRLAGCVFYNLRTDQQACICWMHRLAVDPTHRRGGLGTQLVAGVEAAAWQAGAAVIELGVRIPSDANQRFYRALGYRIEDACAHEGYDWPTYYIMRKRAGAAPRLPQHIRVVPYSPDWPRQFAAEAARIAPAFGDNLVRIHHIGSTSVPGLAAKPIIDMTPEVRDIRLVDAATNKLVALGYEPMGEFGLAGRRYFRRSVDGVRTHHVHVYAAGDPELVRHLALPAYLRAHPRAAQRYAALKQTLAEEHPYDIHAYMDGKDALVKEIQARAAAWYRHNNAI